MGTVSYCLEAWAQVFLPSATTIGLDTKAMIFRNLRPSVEGRVQDHRANATNHCPDPSKYQACHSVRETSRLVGSKDPGKHQD
jgi:hypothetical protein